MSGKRARKAGGLRASDLLALNLALLMLSMSGICSKRAAMSPFLSLPFFLYYGGTLLILAVYALVWQQILKRMPISVAYANKAVGMLWGLVWGIVFFGESLTWGKAAGVALCMAGVVLYTSDAAAPERGKGV